METLRQFLLSHHLEDLVSTLHLLPFFPYSSDDGFSVIDYRKVDPHVGSWGDIQRLRQDFGLMFDLVLNHVSQHSRWFRDYLMGQAPYDRYFIECAPDTDLTLVTRPRSLPVLTPFSTSRGERHLWTTFSPDQVDLNFAESAVLMEMLGTLLEYVDRGARIIRLDAIAYLWKEVGTTCIHRPQTHEIVKLMRDLLEWVAPDVWLLTETNVPHAENVSYFGNGDEAHLVYQFSLPPLLLDAFVRHDAQYLNRWLHNLDPPPPGSTYFNFTASHDGIGVRPLEGIIPDEQLEELLDHVRRQGGRISQRLKPDGRSSAYEMNITYLDALSEPNSCDPRGQADRFLASQAVMLALQGIPGVYFHSLVGTRNDLAAVEASGQARKINRHKYFRDELESRLQTSPLQQRIFAGYRHLLQQRIAHPAFHPAASQETLSTDDPRLLVFRRTPLNPSEHLIVATNFSTESVDLEFDKLPSPKPRRDLISQKSVAGDHWTLSPSSTVWLTSEGGDHA